MNGHDPFADGGLHPFSIAADAFAFDYSKARNAFDKSQIIHFKLADFVQAKPAEQRY